MKYILDSVHGYVSIPRNWCENIVDTVYFQRLRRIEQTSGRSIFPSAHHDRFIHSLGVYHLGSRIVEHLEQIKEGPYVTDEIDELVFNSYRLACLLHDVCHSPFSHTFEHKFGKEKLANILADEIKDESFVDDWNLLNTENTAPHEIMSAIMVKRVFEEPISKLGITYDIPLIARMIVGNVYTKINKENSFRNCMIELIHGEIIDADGMDYACRDSWASGYSTSQVDVDRLIRSMMIFKKNDICYVCYTSKAQNAIESVLNVKTFQQFNVINHHKVTYEQWLLVKAMESAAVFHFYGQEKLNTASSEEREKALEDLCDIRAFTESLTLPHSGVILLYPMDDDFVSLMKYISKDKYVKQWLSRQYTLKPLWKSRTEFYKIFRELEIEKYLNEVESLVKNNLNDLAAELKIGTDGVLFREIKMKNKLPLASEINLFIDGDIHPYTKIFPAVEKYQNSNRFFFVFIDSNADSKKAINFLYKYVADVVKKCEDEDKMEHSQEL